MIIVIIKVIVRMIKKNNGKTVRSVFPIRTVIVIMAMIMTVTIITIRIVIAVTITITTITIKTQ